MDNIKDILKKWIEIWSAGSRMNEYTRELGDYLRSIGTSTFELQDRIALAMSKSKCKLTDEDQLVIKTYMTIRRETEAAKAEALGQSAQGVIFSLKAQNHWEDKQTLQVDNNISLAEIIAKKTTHNGAIPDVVTGEVIEDEPVEDDNSDVYRVRVLGQFPTTDIDEPVDNSECPF